MYLKINNVTPIENYKLILEYSDGDIRIFDMQPYLNKGIFEELKDKNIFNSVKPCYDSVIWSNNADIDPDVLYENSVPYRGSISIQS